MKNIAKLILGIGLVSLATSCSDFLDQSSPSEMTDPFKKVSDAQNVLNKVYAGLTVDNTYGCRLPLNFSTNSDIELVDALDQETTHSNNERGACNYNATPGWDKLDKNWSAMFEIAENATTVIEGVNNSDILKSGNKSDIAEMKRYKAEAVTLRAMIYYDLIKNYGDIPVKFETTQPDGSNMYVGKTDRDEIMERLLNDLKDEAIPYLPWAGEEGYNSEHITKGFAHGLAARIALAYAGYSIRESAKEGYESLDSKYSDGTYPTQRPGEDKRNELYQIALDNTAEVIKSGKHQLNESFDDLWTNSNLMQKEPSQENLFEVAHGLNYSGEMGYTAGVRINGSSSRFGIKGNSSGKVKLTAMLFMSYNENDQRRDVTCAPYEIKESTTVSGKTEEIMQKNTPFGIYVAKWDVRKMEKNKSWLNTVLASTDKVGYGVNWIVMRYSDILLMYAEALNELKGSHTIAGPANNMTALQALEAVHRRAFADKSTATQDIENLISKKGFFNILVQERAWEFAGEGLRKYDLIRWGLLYKKAVEDFAKDYKSLVNGSKNEFSNKQAQETLYYKMTTDENGNSIIDMSSVCWYKEPSDITDYESADWWAKEDLSKGKNAGYLNFISAGLTGDESGVKGRHVLPLGATSVSDSKNTIRNSYGY